MNGKLLLSQITAVQASGGFYDIGTIIPWSATVLDGFLLCDGSTELEPGEFADLFAVIGTTYGVGVPATAQLLVC